MKRFIAIILSCMFLFLCVLSPSLSVKASSQSFTTDYSTLLSVSQMESVLSGLTASELSTLYTSLGGLAYSYLQSVNVDIKASSQNSLLSDLGKQVLSFVFHPLDSIASYASGYVYDSLASNSKYFLSSLFKKVDDSLIDTNNYASVTYEWKSVSSVMSDVFNNYNRVEGFQFDIEAFNSASSSFLSSTWDLSFDQCYSYEVNPRLIYDNVHFNFPTCIIRESGTNNKYLYPISDLYSSYRNFYFDSLVFLPEVDFNDSSNHGVFYENQGLADFNPYWSFPVIFYNSVNHTAFVHRSTSTTNFNIFSSSALRNDGLLTSSIPYGYFPSGVRTSGTYNLNEFANFMLSLSNDLPSCMSAFSNLAWLPSFTNVNAYVCYPNDAGVYNLANLEVYNPNVVIDTSNYYEGSLQIPVDNSPGAVANLDIQSVIDAINDNSLVNNIDRLGSIISDGVVGSIPEVSIDAWNPDKVTEHATSTDISVGLDGLSAIEGTYVDNVAPVFETYPIVPFLQPIFEALGSNVISIIAVCIFIVVLFGFLNKLLF